MKIGLASTGTTLDLLFANVFGRCSFFVIVDSENKEVLTVFPNKARNAAGGAGIQAAQSLIDQKIDAIIAPRLGPNAWSVLKGAGVKIYTGINGTLQENIEAFLGGKLTEMTGASRSGMGRGQGGRMGRGGGQGLEEDQD
ncbi:MAG: NifB/NifX family molybdenum-iron cluster-binding protein [Promethearchaeota archaeon]